MGFSVGRGWMCRLIGGIMFWDKVAGLYDLFEKNKISFEEYRKRALELGEKYR